MLSVVASARPDRKSLPDTSSRPCFGAWICRGYPSYVARFLTAPCFRLSFRRGRTENHCPKLQRVLLSVVASARPDRKSLPETSTRPCFRLSLRRARPDNHYPKLQRALASVHGFVAATRHTLPSFSPRLAFGCRFGAAGQKIIARYFIAVLLRCMDLSRLPPERSPDFHRALLSVVPPARPARIS